MRNQPETVHEYNIPRLNWWFLFSSLLFLICFVLMVWVDYSGGEIRWLGLKGDRQWKNYQREFYELERKRLAADARAAEIRAQEQGLDRLRAQEKELNEKLAAQHDRIRAKQAELARLRVEADRITRDFTMEKATRDEVRSFFEAALVRHNLNEDHPEVRTWRRRVQNQNRLVDELDLEKQAADAKVAEAERELQQLVGERDELERQINRLLGSKMLLTRRLEQLTNPLVQTVVNAPILEFAAPTYRVEQIIAYDHHVDVNFTTVPRVDRCITCHIAIDKKDLSPEEKAWREKHGIEHIEWSKLPQPLRNHPRMDLYVADTSPHPASKFGCTVCHWGWDRETHFARAGHTPDYENPRPHLYDPKLKRWIPAEEASGEAHARGVQPVVMTQRDAWIKNYDWYFEHFNLQPMRQQKYIEASCLKCHTEQTNLMGAEKLDHGRRLVEQLGCWACHKMKQLESYSLHRVAPGESLDEIARSYDVNLEDLRRVNNLPADAPVKVGTELQIPLRILRKPGPSLYNIASKTNPDWTKKWLADPFAFRTNTYMPKFWGLDNNRHTPLRNDVEMHAITTYLFTVSRRPDYPPPPVAGDVNRGKQLVQEVGCLACHVIDEKLTDLKVPDELRPYMDDHEYRRARSQGPQLAGTGSKTTLNWLYAWLKDPKKYHPETKMPNLRLSDQEAADIATYLMTLRNPATDNRAVPSIDPHELDRVTLEYLQVLMPRREAEQKINDLDDLIEPFLADLDLQPYYNDPTRLAREEVRLAELQKQYEETYDDAIQRQIEQLTAQLERVKDKIAQAKQKVAALSPTDKKNVFLGQKLIARYGCYSCHNIHGFENAKPIGVELSEWGSKTVDKLDFGLLNIERDRVSWLKQKLKAPRSYDIGRLEITRSPQEYLRMPLFNLTEEQIEQVITVVTGMTAEKLTANQPRRLSPAEHMIERGRWLVKELNCTGCHQIEGRGWAIRATGIPPGMEPPMVSGLPGQLRQGQRTNPDWLFRFLKYPETGEVRPWLKVRMPTFGLTDAEANVFVKYFAYEGRAQFPYQSPQINLDPAHLAAGKQLFEQLRCALCHIVEGKALGKPLEEIPPEDLPRLAPNLTIAAQRLQREWLIEKWLPAPSELVPGTRMPQFEYGATIAPNILGGDSRKQREALVDYILSLGLPKPPPMTAQAAPPPGGANPTN